MYLSIFAPIRHKQWRTVIQQKHASMICSGSLRLRTSDTSRQCTGLNLPKCGLRCVRRSLLTKVYWQVQGDPWEYSLASQSDDLWWQESHLQLKLLLEHVGDARQVEHTQRSLCAGFNVTLNTRKHTHSVSKEPKNLSRTDTAEIWSTHCGRNDGRSAGPQFSCLRWIWFVDHFQPPFDIVSLDLHIGVNDAVFKAHLASILESHLSFCLMIEHLEESVNKKEVRKTQQDTKVAVCWWKNREINLAFDVRKHRDRQRVAKESKKCESWTNSEDSNVIVIAIAEIFAVTFDFYLVLVVCEMYIFMLLTFSTYWIHNEVKWPAQLWVSSKRTCRPKSTTVGSTL